MADDIRLWFWMITDGLTSHRRQTTWRMTEADAWERHGADAVKVEDSLEVRRCGLGQTSDFVRNMDSPVRRY